MKISKKKAIVIVDAYSSGAYLALAFIGQGYQCIHVLSNINIPSRQLFGESFYSEKIILEKNNLAAVIKKLNKYEIKAVLPGYESGVELADAIANHFNVLKNDVSSTHQRRNKFAMIHALEKAGIPCAKQFASTDLKEIIHWHEQSTLKKTILKPTLAALSQDVAICNNSADIHKAFTGAHGKVNVCGQINNEFVLQEYLDGDEFMVNSVSCHGQHFITDIWIGVGGIKNTISTDEYADLIYKNSPQFEKLSAYVHRILTAVGVQNGPAHSEVRLTPEGPKLIEVGARLTGGLDFALVNECLGYSQLSVTVETVLNPDLFASRINTYKQLSQLQYMRFIYLCSEIEGTIIKNPNLAPFLKIESLKSFFFFHKAGDYLKKTNEVVGRPGYVFLLSNDFNLLEKDYIKFRQLEKKMFLELVNA